MVPPLLFMVSLVISLLPSFYIPTARIISPNLKIIGLFIMAIALIFVIDCYVHFSRHNTTMVYGRKPSHLITSGLFSFTRNPLYLSLTTVLIGLIIFMGNVLALIGPILLIFSLNKFVIPNEERDLEIIFGRKYLNYKKRVPRWL